MKNNPEQEILNLEDDNFNLVIEEKYHSTKTMTSISVLINEKNVVKELQRLFKNQDKNYFDTWTVKLQNLKLNQDLWMNRIQDEEIQKEEYIKMIAEEIEKEKELWKWCKNDNQITKEQKERINKRINRRIELISNEWEDKDNGLIEEDESKGTEEKLEDDSDLNKGLLEWQQDESYKNTEVNEHNHNVKPEQVQLIVNPVKVNNPAQQGNDIWTINKLKHKNTSHQIEDDYIEIKKETFNRWRNLLNSYIEAINYFSFYGLEDKIEDAKKKASIIDNAIKSLNQNKEINEFSDDFPIQITPNYICDMNESTRMKKFILWITFCKNQIQILDKMIKRTLDKDSKEALISEKSDLIKKQNQFEKDKLCIWKRLPKFEIMEDPETNVKANLKSKEMEIEVRNFEQPSNMRYDHFEIIIEDEIQEVINITTQKNEEYLYKNKFQFSTSKKNLQSNKIKLMFYKVSLFCFRSSKTVMEFSWEEFQKYDTLIFNKCDNLLKNSGSTMNLPEIEIIVRISSPLSMSGQGQTVRKKLIIIQEYEPFTPPNKPIINPVSIVLGNNRNKCIKTAEDSNETKNKCTSNDNIKAHNFSKNQLNNPNDLSLLNTWKVLEVELKRCEEEYRNIQGRAPKELLQRKTKLKIKLTQLKQHKSLETLDIYIQLVEQELIKHREWSSHFNQTNEKDKETIINNRIKWYLEELKELKNDK